MKKINLLNATAYLSVACALVFLVLRVLLINSYFPDIGGVENNVIYTICKSLYGGSLYENPEINNFNITQYTPIYYYLCIAICKLLNLHPLSDLHAIYITSRGLSLLFNLLGGFVIFRLLTQLFRVNKKIAVVAICVYFISLSRIHFAARPDSLFSLLFIVMSYFFVAYFTNQHDKNMALFLGIAVAVIAIFVKQTGIQYVVLIPLFFMFTGNFKMCVKTGGLLLVFTALFYFLFRSLYQESFFSNVVGGLHNSTSIARIYDMFSFFFSKFQLLFVAGVLSAFVFFDTKKAMSLRFLSFVSSFLFLFAFVTSMKSGSWINYYNEFIIAVILISAIAVNTYNSAYLQEDKLHKAAAYLLALYLVIWLPNSIVQKVFHEHWEHLKASREDFIKREQIAQVLNQKLGNKSYFLSFDMHLNSMLANKAVIPNKDLVPLESAFDYTQFNYAVDSGLVNYIVLRVKDPIPSFMGINFARYHSIYKDNLVEILQYNNP